MADHYWVHNLDPILIHFNEHTGIRYYGLAYVLAFVIAYLLMRQLHARGKFSLNDEQQSSLLTVLVISVLLGGRLGYMILYDLPGFWRDPLSVFRIWEGGMASHGGFIGVLLGCWWASRKFQLPYLSLGDVLATLVPPGLVLGRLANFINGELWGKISAVPWAVIFPLSAPPGTPLSQIPPRHPSQLYAAGLEGLVLLAYTQWRIHKTKALDHPGRLAGEFLVLYTVLRIVGEQFREPDASLIAGMSRGVFYSLFFGLLGAILIWRSTTPPSKNK